MKLLLISVTLFTCSILSAQEHHHHQHGKDSSQSANAYMHQRSTADLIKEFESPERDAYQQPEKVMAYLGDVKNKTVMDIGAGSGYFSVKLAKAGAKVIAADVDEKFQAALKKRIEENNIQNISLRKIHFDNPDLNNGEVDMVLIVNTYHHIDNRSAYFAKVKQGIKQGGALVLIDFFKAEVPVGPPVNHKVSIDEMITELRKAGFTSFEVNVDLLAYQYIVKAK